MPDALFLIGEPTFGSYVDQTGDPIRGVNAVSQQDGQARIELRELGATRGLSETLEGAYKPQGSISASVRPGEVGLLLRSAMGTVTKSTPSGGTAARDHVFDIDDDAVVHTLSAQLQQSRMGTTEALNLRGLVVDQLTLSVAAEQESRLSVNYLAVEEKMPGTAFDNGNVSPAAVAVAYAAQIAPLTFDSVKIYYGGTATKDGTTKRYTLAGAGTLVNVENVEIVLSNNMSHRIFLDSKYAGTFHQGDREPTCSFTLDNETPHVDFYEKHSLVTQEPLQILIEGTEIETGFNYALEITFPNFDYGDVPWGELMGSNAERTIQIAGRGLVWDTEDEDINLRLRDGDDTGYDW